MDNNSNNNTNYDDRFYTLKEISGMLGISYNHLVNNVVKTGNLETVNIGKGTKPQHRVTQQALNEFLSKQSSQQNTIQSAVAELQKIRNSVVISYITSQNNAIKPEDALFLSDILEDIKRRKSIAGKIPTIDIFINSFGGSLDAAYKISRLLWQYADNVNAIVPIAAKSAATAICIGTKEITMSPISELGPVDPIIENPVTKAVNIPARSVKVLLSYASDKHKLEVDKIDTEVIRELRSKLEPLLVGSYLNAIHASKEYLRLLLNNYMFSGSKSEMELDKMVDNLTEKYYSHAFVIDISEAQKIGLNARLASEDEGQATKKLMVFYNKFMNSQGLTKLIGNEFFQIHQKMRGEAK